MLLFLSLISTTVNAAEPCRENAQSEMFPPVALVEYVSGLSNPVYLTFFAGQDKRLFVVEQAGVVRIIKNGKLLPEVFLDIRDRVSDGGEKGLLSIAFHPRYDKNGYVFVNYTGKENAPGDLFTFVSRFKRGADGKLDSESEKVILKIEQPFSNHNGGQIVFGPDSYLYVGMGDGGLANDPFGHGQNLDSLLGALLRINVDLDSAGRNYTIPEDNPFVGRKDARPEIWAYGLRNPWRFSFDPATGDLYLADVGQDKIEEINIIERGGNYGWSVMEGELCSSGKQRCQQERYKRPVYSYPHPQGFAITGGYVYRGNDISGMCGVYLYADYVTKRLWGLRYKNGSVLLNQELLKIPGNISSFGRDNRGEIYLLGHQSGRIFKLIEKN